VNVELFSVNVECIYSGAGDVLPVAGGGELRDDALPVGLNIE
jgi:hypothetical protein